MTTYNATERNQENAQHRRLLFTYEPYQLIGGLFLLVIGVWIGSRLFAGDNGYGTNLYTEVLSIGVTVLVLNVLAQRREDRRELQRLKALMASDERAVTQIAVSELKARGWLADGSLKWMRLRKANLQGADLIEANLQGANLEGANLQGADLRDANLQGARLWKANLQGAGLRYANLQGAVLLDANLQGADLYGANLQGANLWGANLQETFMSRANLQGADLRRANLTHANLYAVECDENTLLPDSEYWMPDEDWMQFGAVAMGWEEWRVYGQKHGILDERGRRTGQDS